jgi:hypothetical protein
MRTALKRRNYTSETVLHLEMLEARHKTDKHEGEDARKIRRRGVESALRDWRPSG